jgi:nucleotidyltransferase substrate binding protein (TIGR01987 family)
MTLPDASGNPLPRWAYRFDNFNRAYLLLREAVDLAAERVLSPLEKEGTVQRFEYCWELAWKLMADDLEAEGITLQPRTPRQTVRSAAAAGLIESPDRWMRALDARNKLSHVYNFAVFAKIIDEMPEHYLPLFDQLNELYQPRRLALILP